MADKRPRRPTPGEWMVSARFGPCVCIEDRGDYFRLRYAAIHLNSGRPIWAGSTDGERACEFQAGADAKSRYVLSLSGAYPFDEQPAEEDTSMDDLLTDAIGYAEQNLRLHTRQLLTLRELDLPDEHPSVVQARSAVAASEKLIAKLEARKMKG
jgi:hypothetical protein